MMTDQSNDGFKHTKLNGGRITEHLFSTNIDALESIAEVYYRGTEPTLSQLKHGFVMCKTEKGVSFICHIRQPDSELKDLASEMKQRAWQPQKDLDVLSPRRLSNPKSYGALQEHLLHVITPKFNDGVVIDGYIAALNDCRHYADEVFAFLSG